MKSYNVDANIKAMESEKLKGGEVINISSGDSYSINYLANLIGGEKQYLPPRPGDVLHTKANITLAKNLLNWQPKTSFKEGLKRIQKWFGAEIKTVLRVFILNWINPNFFLIILIHFILILE